MAGAKAERAAAAALEAELAAAALRVERDAAAALEAGDWHLYMLLHDSHERLGALVHLLLWHGREVADRDYWRLLADAWMHDDFVHVDLAIWRVLFGAARQGREHLMTPDERERLAGLDACVAVYRGFDHPAGADGIAWTLDRERAEWFARRFAGAGEAWVASANIPRERIVALLDGRSESEVIITELGDCQPQIERMLTDGGDA